MIDLELYLVYYIIDYNRYTQVYMHIEKGGGWKWGEGDGIYTYTSIEDTLYLPLPYIDLPKGGGFNFLAVGMQGKAGGGGTTRGGGF